MTRSGSGFGMTSLAVCAAAMRHRVAGLAPIGDATPTGVGKVGNPYGCRTVRTHLYA